MIKMWLMFFLLLTTQHTLASETLFIGVQDYNNDPIEVSQLSQGLTQYLSRALARPVKIETTRSHEKFLAMARNKQFAFLYAPASMIMEAHKLAGYEPIVKISGRISASFVTPTNSGIAFPEDMQGKRIGFTDKNAMITKLALVKLKELHINPATYFQKIIYCGDVDGIASAFKFNQIDIGVVNTSASTLLQEKGIDTNLILQSISVPHLSFAARPDLPANIKQLMAQALISANKDKQAQTFLTHFGFSGFESASLSDYTELAKILNIN